MFGNKEFDNKNVYVLNNAIDLDSFKYDKKVRKEIRKELNISDDKFVIGHVGRFVQQKNHTFILDIFNEVYKENKNALLVLVGQGPLVDEMKNKCNELNISEAVMFVGQRTDVNKLYQAFDYFLFPSLYEGLGMVAIEAQCAGLPCLCSTEVPMVAKASDNIEFLKLDDDISLWKKAILSKIDFSSRKGYSLEVGKYGYDINIECKKLLNIYFTLV